MESINHLNLKENKHSRGGIDHFIKYLSIYKYYKFKYKIRNLGQFSRDWEYWCHVKSSENTG